MSDQSRKRQRMSSLSPVLDMDIVHESTEKLEVTGAGSTDEMLEDTAGLLSQISVQDEESNEDELMNACSKQPCIDGKYFIVDFEKSALGGAIYATCCICNPKKIIKGTLRVNSNFITHIKKIHSDIYDEYLEYAASKRTDGKNKQLSNQKRWACRFSQTKFEENVVRFILDSMAPFSTVEKESFRQIFDDLHIKKGENHLTHISRYTLVKKINEINNEDLKNIRQAMGKVIESGNFICTTADVWTGGGRRFLRVTASWIDSKSFERKSAAIACKRFPGTHSYDAIATHLSRINKSFNSKAEDIRATVTDNGSNFVKAFKEFGIDASNADSYGVRGDQSYEDVEIASALSEDEMSEDDHDVVSTDSFDVELPRHLRCASHTLNLLATTDISKIIESSEHLNRIHSVVLEKCNSLWKLFRSPKLNECLKTELGVSLKRPIITRWNSFYDSIKQLISIQDKLLQLQRDSESGIKLTHPFRRVDFQYMREYVMCTTDIAIAIDRLQADNCHYGILFPNLVSLRRKLSALLTRNDLEFCRVLVEGTIVNLEKRSEQFFAFHVEGINAAIAAVSLPQFKNRWLCSLSKEHQKRIHDAFLLAVSNESEKVLSQHTVEELDDDFDFGDDSSVIPEFRPSITQTEIGMDINKYLKSPNKSIYMLMDYPAIKNVFLKYNTPLPSSAAVQRLFSYATMMQLPKCNRLTDENFETRVLAKANSSKLYV